MSESARVRIYRCPSVAAARAAPAGIRRWRRLRLETRRDHIQLLFPIWEERASLPHAPGLCDEEVERFQRAPRLGQEFHRSFSQMLAFLGLRQRPDGAVAVATDWQRGSPEWVQPGKHSPLRKTRITSSTRTLGQRDLSGDPAADLATLPDARVAATREYWRAAPR